MICFNCHHAIMSKIYRGCDQNFCSDICRNKIYLINLNQDPNLNYPISWIKTEDQLIKRSKDYNNFNYIISINNTNNNNTNNNNTNNNTNHKKFYTNFIPSEDYLSYNIINKLLLIIKCIIFLFNQKITKCVPTFDWKLMNIKLVTMMLTPKKLPQDKSCL